MIIIMLGAPGAGKGTVGKKIAERLNLKHLASGDIFRSLVKEGSELGNKIGQMINKGKLIPDNLATEIIEQKILENDLEKGIILDGYPRTEEQVKSLNKLLEKNNYGSVIVFNIDVSEDLIIDRIVNRRICSNCGEIYNLKYGKKPKIDGKCDKCDNEIIQRADDNAETVRDRLDNYRKLTKPVLECYKKQNCLCDLHSDKNTNADEVVEKALEYIKVKLK